jgi:transposase
MKKNNNNKQATGALTGDSATKRTVGIDLGEHYAKYAVLELGDEFLEQGKIPMTEAGFRRQFEHWKPALMAIEAGTHARWVARVLKEMGHEVIVANPRELRALTHSAKKNDGEDARKLARYARADVGLLKPVQLRSEAVQKELLKLQTRDVLVRTRAHLTSTVRGLVKGFGARVPKCTTQGFAVRAAQSLPEEIRSSLQPVLDVVALLTEFIKEADAQVDAMVAEHPVAARLDGIAGVGPVTAMTFVLTIEEASRYRRSRDVGAAMGLTPRSDQSGESDPQLGITKQGNELMRRLLVQCGQRLLGPQGQDCAIRQWGLKLAGEGKNKKLKKRAVVAVARKLAVVMHRLWVTGEQFVPFPAGQPKTKAA